MKKTLKGAAAALALLLLSLSLFAACGKEEAPKAALPDGEYSALFETDSSMFHVNETKNGRGVLTVKDGEMSIHISLPSKTIVNLFMGSKEEAQKEGAALLYPTVDTVTYPDGTKEEVNGFDIPVPYLDEGFACALIGKKGVWYDHTVSVKDPEPNLSDGEYTCEVALLGGSGKASVSTPAKVTVKDGKAFAEIVWSSPNYDFMIVGGERYEPSNTSGNSVFVIPVDLDGENAVQADTVAMSKPYLIDYVLTFDKSTLK